MWRHIRPNKKIFFECTADEDNPPTSASAASAAAGIRPVDKDSVNMIISSTFLAVVVTVHVIQGVAVLMLVDASSSSSSATHTVNNVNGVNLDAVRQLASRWIHNPNLLEQLRFEVLEDNDETSLSSSSSSSVSHHYTNRSSQDIFEYEAGGTESDVPPKVIFRGTTTAALTAGLGWYLKYECHVHLSWTGDQLNTLHDIQSLPIPTHKVQHRRNGQFSYYQNVCTVSYSMVWWTLERWYRELDWMALSGINFPLAFQGQEIVWHETFMKLFQNKSRSNTNDTNDDKGSIHHAISTWLGGPAFMAWQRMGNIQAWGGPMPQQWINQNHVLQINLLERMTDLGMKPILPAFAGFVPPITTHYFPNANISLSSRWGGFNASYTPVHLVEPTDPLFQTIGNLFLKMYRQLYPSYFAATPADQVHYYNADTYNEMDPKRGDLPYLKQASKAVFHSIRSVDSTAVWVMQGWLFESSGFWTKERIQAYLSGVDDDPDTVVNGELDGTNGNGDNNDDRLIILDLMSEVNPVYERSDYYFGKSYIYNMLHNFGGNHGLYGRMHKISHDPIELFKDKTSSSHVGGVGDGGRIQQTESRDVRHHTLMESNNNIQGVGITMEGINQNFLVYDLMTEMSWRSDTGLDNDEFLSQWVDDYVTRRYGLASNALSAPEDLVRRAWQQLLKTVYTCPTEQYGVTKSVAVRRPQMGNMTHTGFMPSALFYDPRDLQVAWKFLLEAGGAAIVSGSNLKTNFLSLETYRYDLVDVTRQCLSDILLRLQIEMWQAYEKRDIQAFGSASTRFMEVMDDMETILATHDLFLFETQWLAPARSLAGNDDDLSAFYEFNAKNQVTLWGPEGEISDYASKQFASLMAHYYRPRWALFVDAAVDALKRGIEFDNDRFVTGCKYWEKKWGQQRHKYQNKPTGDTVEVSEALYEKYVIGKIPERTKEWAVLQLYSKDVPLWRRLVGLE